MDELHYCVDCGMLLNTNDPRVKRCPECRHKRSLVKQKEYKSWRKQQRLEEEQKLRSEGYFPPKQIKSNRADIIDINERAKAAGMTYGQYVSKYGY